MSSGWTIQVPSYDQLTLPLLQLASDGQVHTLREAAEYMAAEMALTKTQRSQTIPSGKRRRFDDRLAWAKTYLTRAGLLERAGWGRFRITQRGLDVLAENPPVINRRYLARFPEFRAQLRQGRTDDRVPDDPFFSTAMTPEEVMEAAYLGMQQDLADRLIEVVLSVSPEFFESLVIDLLLAMGYGGSRQRAAQALGGSGDGGIDGLIQEDKLGLDTIYVQAKRYSRDHPVGRPALQGFVGSLIGKGGKKGVFITTSRFTQDGIDYAEGVTETRVILIDGVRLTQLMMEHGVGVVTEKIYQVQTIDRDYFQVD